MKYVLAVFYSIVALVAVLAAAGAVYDWWQRPPPAGFAGRLGPVVMTHPPRTVPELRFADAEGRAVTLADFRGRLVVLNLWATWCAPCVEELPTLDRLQARLGGPQFAVVALSLDRDGLAAVAPFLEQHGIKRLTIYLDPANAASHALTLRGLPTTLVVGPDGNEIGRLEGAAAWDAPAAEAFLRSYFAKPPRAG